MPRMAFELRSFPPGNRWGLSNGYDHFDISIRELLHAAVTVGHPDYHTVLGGGSFAAVCEMMWKATACLMTLRTQTGRGWAGFADWLSPTQRFANLDPSEKRGATYQMGLTVTMLLARRLFGIRWLMHLDVYWNSVGATLQPGRSRPDLVGTDPAGGWCIFESKGRVSQPDGTAKQNAKSQAGRVISVGGSPPVLGASVFGYFRAKTLRRASTLEAFCADPPPNGFNNDEDGSTTEPILLDLSEEQVIHEYYGRFLPLFDLDQADETPGLIVRALDDLDLTVQLDRRIPYFLERQAYDKVRQIVGKRFNTLPRVRERSPVEDGIEILPGRSWEDRFARDR